MNEPDSKNGDKSWKEAREQRLAALRSLSAAQRMTEVVSDASPIHGMPSVSLAPRRPRSRGVRPRLLALLALAVVAAGAGGFVALQRLRQGSTQPHASAAIPALRASTFSLLTLAGLRCTSSPVWSPDGHSFAVIGTRATQCTPFLESLAFSNAAAPNLFSPPQTLAIFDASSGHLSRSFDLDPLLGNRPNCNAQGQCGDDTARSALFYGLSWSPDGQWLALAYLDGSPLPPAPFPLAVTLLTMHPDGTGATRIREDNPNFLGLYDEENPGIHVWDLHTQTVSFPDTRSWYPYSAPFSASYQWGSQITAGPQPDEAAASGRAGPVGNPSGGATFTPWQPGIVVPVGAASGTGQAALFETLFWSWSPDGRYVATFLSTGGVLELPGASPSTPPPQNPPVYLPLIPVRDAALASVAASTTDPNAMGGGNIEVAWSPDDAKLAALRCTDATTGWLEIRATATGKLLGVGTQRYVPTGISQECAGDMEALAWSPDGTRIMTGDTASATVTIWHVA